MFVKNIERNVMEGILMLLLPLDIEKFVKVNDVEEVTNPIALNGSMPTDDGLFSFKVFGFPGSPERQENYAYINLNSIYFHPMVYLILTQIDRNFSKILTGERLVSIKGGKLEPDPKGSSGIEFLYENWEKIKWKPDPSWSKKKSDRYKILMLLDKKVVFIKKFIVCPALYRDITFSIAENVREIPEINNMYNYLIVSAAKTQSGFLFIDSQKKLKVQQMLLDIHKFFLDMLPKKTGVFQDKLLGKFVDYAVQAVISTPKVHVDHPANLEVPFGYLGIPLHLVVNMFTPFVIKEIDTFFNEYLIAKGHIPVYEIKELQPIGKTKYIEIPKEIRAALTSQTVSKWINHIMRNPQNRLDPIFISLGGKEYGIDIFDKEFPYRHSTLLDLFYFNTYKVVANKSVLFTRYPVEDYLAPHYGKVNIITVEDILPEITVFGYPVKRYPDLKQKIRWIESVRYNQAYCAAAVADFDGDRIKIVGIYTDEANQEANDIRQSLRFIVDGESKPVRNTGNEGNLGIYMLTKD